MDDAKTLASHERNGAVMREAVNMTVGCAGMAGKISPLPLEKMMVRYA